MFFLLECEIDEKCSDDSIPYKASSGEGTEKHPFICFNNKLYVGCEYTEIYINFRFDLD